MSKTGRPWFRKGTNAWYVWHEGRQVRLARGRSAKAEAHAAFAALLSGRSSDSSPHALTVGETVAGYTEFVKTRVSAPTQSSYACVLAAFTRTFGARAANSIRAADVEGWAGQLRWSQTTQRYALTVVRGVFRWAVNAGKLSADPLKDLRRPPGRSRGAAILIDCGLHERLLAVASPQFRDFIQAVHGTGARPGEVARVEAKDVVWDASCWLLSEHKTSRTTGRVRIIHIPPNVLAICRRLADRHTSGPLFRTTRGEPWRKSGWKQAMARAQRRLGLERRPMTSGYRHSFATDALEAGVPDAHVAELLGHASTAMLARHYAHLSARAEVLRAGLDRIRSDQRTEPS